MPIAPGSYSVTCFRMLAPNVTFIRVHANNLAVTLAGIIRSVSDLCWISQIDPFLKRSFQAKAAPTAVYLASLMASHGNSHLASDTGEYFVSEVARSAVVNHLNYLDIPLGELLKQQISGNPGFDFYSMNQHDTILFGEAKYVAGVNAYGNALKQIHELIDREEDLADLHDIRDFCTQQSLDNANHGIKGYIAAFSSTNIADDVLINHLQQNRHYPVVTAFQEVICVAIDIQ